MPTGDRARGTAADRLRSRAEHLTERAGERLPFAADVLETLDRERAAGGGLLAGGLAYRFFFWLVPFGLLLGAALGFWVEADRAGFDETAGELGIGDVLASGAADAIAEGRHSRWYLVVVGAVFMAWFSISAARALRTTQALAYGERPPRMRRPLAAGTVFTAAVSGVIAVSLAAAWVREQNGALGLGVTVVVLLFYASLAVVAMALMPHADAPLRTLLPGAALVALGLQALHVFVALYLGPRLGRSSELYGVFGAATTILLGLYLTARLLILSMFLNATLWDARGGGVIAGPSAPATIDP